jgi:hypothetical protein
MNRTQNSINIPASLQIQHIFPFMFNISRKYTLTKRGGIPGEWRILHNVTFHNLLT